MRAIATRLGGATIVSLLGTTAALADLTAEEVWQGWQDSAERWGGSLAAGDSTAENGRLVLQDVVYSYSDERTSVEHVTPEVVLEETGDGRVAIRLSEEMRLSVEFIEGDDDPSRMELAVRHDDLEIHASGPPDQLQYDSSAARIALDLENLEGPDAEDFDSELSIVATDFTARDSYDGAPADLHEVFMEAGTLDVALSYIEHDGTHSTILDWTAEEAGLTYSATGIAAMEEATTEDALTAGLVLEGAVGHSGSRYNVEIMDDVENGAPETGTIEGSSVQGSAGFGLSAEGLSYDATSRDALYRISNEDMPVPVMELMMEELHFETLLPVVESDAPQDFGTLLRIDGLTVGDDLWAMVDPDGALPRDPATLLVDVDGRANWESNPLDTAAAGPRSFLTQSPAQMGEMHELNLNALSLRLLGAHLSGDGAFTFDNEDLETFQGMPRPEGSLTLVLEGAEALIDQLIATGAIRQEDAMGAMMMMSMFAQPGETEDSLTTTLEIDADGGVIANGQRLR